jgi:hypothetical protein
MKKTRMLTIMFLTSFVVVLTLVGSVATGGIVFLDDFEDGSATDGAPVTWSPVPGATGSFEVIGGDYVLTHPTANEEMYSHVHQYTLADMSIRTQARLIGSNATWIGLGARGKPGVGTYVAALKNNSKLNIWRFGSGRSDWWPLASVDVGIDPRAQDVLLRFDVVGNELSAWAWQEGDPMPAEPQVTTVHSEFATGGVGVGVDLGSRYSNSEAIFRYVEVYVPIPPTPDFNGDGIVDSVDMCMMVDYWGTDEPLYDIAPSPFGDGVVDVQDLIVLAEHLFEDYRFVAHWKMDETEGGIAYDSVGDNDGTLNGNPLWQSSGGKANGALQLDGLDDYISTPLIMDTVNGSLSAFAWIKGGTQGQVIISQTGDFNGTWLGINPSGDNLMTGFSAMYFGALVSETVITDGQWHHVGFVYDTDTFHRRLYVDGAQVAEDATAVSGMPSDDGLYIGASKDLDSTSFFSGLIDDVRIYNSALSTEEIAALAQ